ncbi:hypothetical protein C7M84_003705 [Penaeus vannamei]|uniref:Uncharacterized protein n=1 Tax=Penaeus vannamei TaxID=6689 RepID=A0A3R7PUR4_PENVA|nr:hypothetical protein C7M84_003705 [Penaeus vannamei]
MHVYLNTPALVFTPPDNICFNTLPEDNREGISGCRRRLDKRYLSPRPSSLSCLALAPSHTAAQESASRSVTTIEVNIMSQSVVLHALLNLVFSTNITQDTTFPPESQGDCHGVLGCFPVGVPPWVGPERPVSLPPLPPSRIAPTFCLHTPARPNCHVSARFKS